MAGDWERYEKQIRLKEIGEAGQRRLAESSVAVIGCGALGSVIADSIVRAGVGRVVVVDRDYIELDNLQRQVLFDEEDIARDLPKAVAAAERLKKINGRVRVEPLFSDVTAANIESIVGGVDLVMDGTDNFETRFLINDACVKLGIPWTYGGVIGTEGMSYLIIPGETSCFRCLMQDTPPPGSVPTCETEGVLGVAVHMIASLEVTEALKLLTGNDKALLRCLIAIDVWKGEYQRLRIEKREGLVCRCCDERRFDFLEARTCDYAVGLCGRNAVQISPREEWSMKFEELAERLKISGGVSFNEYMLRFQTAGYEFIVLRDGRTIVKGTTDSILARTMYARYIGA
jgi:molybdopterin/thiamine biosynthesis adenylyltransferase